MKQVRRRRHFNVKEFLLSNRTITPEGCWLWALCKDKDGYGTIRYEDTTWRVHRLSMKVFKPEEFSKAPMTLHQCNTKACFNPDHLYQGNTSDNTLDTVKAGNHINASKTICIRGHEYTEENTYRNPKTGQRSCKICRKAVRDISNIYRVRQQ